MQAYGKGNYNCRLKGNIIDVDQKSGSCLDPNNLYVYVNAFMASICDVNQDAIDTMLASDESEI